jgi:hypothetical protein
MVSYMNFVWREPVREMRQGRNGSGEEKYFSDFFNLKINSIYSCMMNRCKEFTQVNRWDYESDNHWWNWFGRESAN